MTGHAFELLVLIWRSDHSMWSPSYSMNGIWTSLSRRHQCGRVKKGWYIQPSRTNAVWYAKPLREAWPRERRHGHGVPHVLVMPVLWVQKWLAKFGASVWWFNSERLTNTGQAGKKKYPLLSCSVFSLVAAVAPGHRLPKQMVKFIHRSCYGRKIPSNRDRPREEEDRLSEGIRNEAEE